MVLNTLSVGAAVTPTVTKTWVSHYVNRKPLRKKPTAHISYDLGLHLVRRFVEFSALHTVEELQAFTGQWVPAPRWVKTEDVAIDEANVTKAAEYIQHQLGEDGIEQVGGREWWQWRREDTPLKAEWIEMRRDWQERRDNKENGNRVMLYVHGGAYYFGSVNEHRYQIQRHARKLKAKCLAPRYRLAPQFPFPCGLHDCLAAYLYLLGRHHPSEIIVAGDSAGGGMVLSLLVVLRDQGLPLPAGGVLLSPWVDLTHSFPSICDDASLDYIPGDGFIHKPSMGWPPPTVDDVDEAGPSSDAGAQSSEGGNANETANGNVIGNANGKVNGKADGNANGKVDGKADGKGDAASERLQSPTSPDTNGATTPVSAADRKRGYSVLDPSNIPQQDALAANTGIKMAQGSATPTISGTIDATTHLPAVMVDGKLIQIRDQIQMYAPNHLLFHPLVSPVLQPSLGGLPPILIQVGGGELLRDEQLYLAHKMANPAKYQPRKTILDYYDPDRTTVNKHKPTNVQVQLWEDMCHVGHTLSFTRPAKFMYRSVAQFGAWALAHAQHRPIDIPMHDYSDTDSISSQEDEDGNTKKKSRSRRRSKSATRDAQPEIPVIKAPTAGSVGKAGDPLPPFKNHMIRQRVDRHGDIYDLGPESDIPALNLSAEEIGILKEGPVKKWLIRQEKWNKRFSGTKRDLQRKRAQQLAKGYVGLAEGEKPPPTALAGMRTKDLPRVSKLSTSWGMMMWSGWGSKHDQIRVKQNTADDVKGDDVPAHEEESSRDLPGPAGGTRDLLRPATSHSRSRSRPRSRSQSVRDEGQANGSTFPLTSPEAQANGTATLPLAIPSSPTDPETKSSSLTIPVSPETESNSLAVPIPPGATVIGNTIIPSTETTSTRPTDKEGIAYPFKLKGVQKDDVRSENASIITLESEVRPLSPLSPGIGGVGGDGGGIEKSANGTPVVENGIPILERPPAPERFETAREVL